MSMHPSYFVTIAAFAILSIHSTGCIGADDGSEERPSYDYPPPTSFEIPERPYHDRTLISESESYDPNMFSRGNVVLGRGREHMNPDENHHQFWLEKGEPIVFDFSYKLWGYGGDYDYDLIILANF